jgi:hypothetical protein
VAVGLALLLIGPALAAAQPQGMDLRQASGVPLPAADLPAGTVSVRVVRGSFANNLTDVDVIFTVDGRTTTVKTDAGGRAQIDGLPAGATVSAVARVDGQELVSQASTIGTSGIRYVLVAADPEAAGAGSAASGPAQAAVPGTVSLGPDTRVLADVNDERLTIYYVLHLSNASGGPVETGGPIVFDLPAGARGAQSIEGTTGQVTVAGERVSVLGPFAPGTTNVNLAFELPFSGSTAVLEQAWPIAAERLTVFAVQSGEMDLQSTQLVSKQSTVDQGQPLVIGYVSALPADHPLRVEISGLPHHAQWPRQTALALGGGLLVLGLWAAIVPASRRRAA